MEWVSECPFSSFQWCVFHVCGSQEITITWIEDEIRLELVKDKPRIQFPVVLAGLRRSEIKIEIYTTPCSITPKFRIGPNLLACSLTRLDLMMNRTFPSKWTRAPHHVGLARFQDSLDGWKYDRMSRVQLSVSPMSGRENNVRMLIIWIVSFGIESKLGRNQRGIKRNCRHLQLVRLHCSLLG